MNTKIKLDDGEKYRRLAARLRQKANDIEYEARGHAESLRRDAIANDRKAKEADNAAR